MVFAIFYTVYTIFLNKFIYINALFKLEFIYKGDSVALQLSVSSASPAVNGRWPQNTHNEEKAVLWYLEPDPGAYQWRC